MSVVLLSIAGIIISFTIYLVILKPLIPLLILKVRFGKEAYLAFYPIQGFFKMINLSL